MLQAFRKSRGTFRKILDIIHLFHTQESGCSTIVNYSNIPRWPLLNRIFDWGQTTHRHMFLANLNHSQIVHKMSNDLYEITSRANKPLLLKNTKNYIKNCSSALWVAIETRNLIFKWSIVIKITNVILAVRFKIANLLMRLKWK